MGLEFDFYEFGSVINSLIIGQERDVERYAQLLSQSAYYKSAEKYIVAPNPTDTVSFDRVKGYDAVFLLSQLSSPVSFFSECIRVGLNLYFVDQINIDSKDIAILEALNNELDGLLFPEFTELNYPIFEDFISVDPHLQQYRYARSLSGKKDIRQSLMMALGFLQLLSPMPVRKIDVGTIDTTQTGRPSVKVRLKMYDSSVCQILLDIDNLQDHTIDIESAKGQFHFDLVDNYLENIHGTRFFTEETTASTLLARSIDSFALNIILNKKPVFSFHHYLSAISLVIKIENILNNSF